MRVSLLLAAGLVAMLWPTRADAANPTIYGTETNLWKEMSVVYGRVTGVAIPERGLAEVTLAVETTLTGKVDAAATGVLRVDLRYGAIISSVGYAPRAGKQVVVVLKRDEMGDRYLIPSATMAFMPLTELGPPDEQPPLAGVEWGKSHASIMEVTGFDDPKVAEVIARLRELRAPKYEGPPKDKVLTNSLGMKLVRIDAGEFMMGSPQSDEDADARETPQHRVRISEPFCLGMYEVTQGQYEQVMGENPSRFKGDLERPVDSVTWHEAVAFCRKLSEKEGVTYRLPTEAEWEYACRAGSKSRYPFGNYPIDLGEYAFWSGNSKDTTHHVGLKTANRWGLFDMLGNVSEWCADDWHVGRVVRGGSSYFNERPPDYRCAARRFAPPGERNEYRGFRVVRVVTP